jgi:hypothetical protein
MSPARHSGLWLVPAAMLLLGLFPLPYGYYTFLRIVVCTSAAILCYAIFADENNLTSWSITFGLIAVLFNPIIPIHLKRDFWYFIDIGCSAIYVIHWFRAKQNLKG